MKKSMTIILASLILGLGLSLLGLAVRSGLNSISSRERTVDVRGLAEREVPANKVTWPLSYTLVGDDLQSLYDRMNTTNATLSRFLTSNGIAETEISVNAPKVNDLQADRYNNNPIPYRYNLSVVMTVVTGNVDLVTKLIKRQGELLKEGIALNPNDYSNQTIYEYTALNDIKPEMIAEATENARQAAKKFADDSESKIGKIKTARQGQFSITDRDPYTPQIKTVRVVTSLTYYLED
ncbi:MAG: SIMPL domain-containing protein [Clostridium sp.]|nr:SIMPL domain-containing protein [Clostridium sp.]